MKEQLNLTTEAIIKRRRRKDHVNKAREDNRVKQIKKVKKITKDDRIWDPEVYVKKFKRKQRSFQIYKRRKQEIR